MRLSPLKVVSAIGGLFCLLSFGLPALAQKLPASDDFTSLKPVWKTEDINVDTAGTVKVQDGRLIVSADGADIWGTADQFTYVYQEVSGDFFASLQVVQAPKTHGWSKAGLMVRQTTDAGSIHAFVCGTRDNGVRLQFRASDGGSSSDRDSGVRNLNKPVWVGLLKAGNKITALVSRDGGQTWTAFAEVTLADLTDPVLFGIATTSHQAGTLGEGIFDDLVVQPLGKITGTVKDGAGNAVEGAVVTATGPIRFQAVTDAGGNYTLGVLGGDYQVSAFKPGQFAPSDPVRISVAPGASATQNITLGKLVVLTAYPVPYTGDWVNSEMDPKDYDVVATDPAYDFDSLKEISGKEFKVGNIPFLFPDVSKGKPNVAPIALATFLFSPANYTALHILASSGGSAGGGTYNGVVTLTYSDGTSETRSISIANRTGAPTANETVAFTARLRDNEGTETGDGNIFYQFIPVDASRQLVSAGFSSQLFGSTVATPMLWAMTVESAQKPEDLGTVTGTVKDPQGNPAAGSIVSLGPLQATTKADGKYLLVAPKGSYTIGALQPGIFAPITDTVSVEAGKVTTKDLTLGLSAIGFQVPLNFTGDWISGADLPGDYTFGDTAFIAEQLPVQAGRTKFGNVEFLFGGLGPGEDNMIFVNGQTIPVPEGNYHAFYILESCVSGFYTKDATLKFSDGTEEKVRLQFTDWCGGASAIEKEWKRTVQRHNPSGPTAPNCAIFFQPHTIKNFTKVLKSITLPTDPSGYATNSGGLFALTLESGKPIVGGKITGKVQGPSGPVAGAQVVVGYDPNTDVTGSGFVAATTDANGNFSGIAPEGTHKVSVVAKGSGLMSPVITANIQTGQTTDLGTITLTPFPNNQVVIWLGTQNVGRGIVQMEGRPINDSDALVTQPATAGGEEGRKSVGGWFGFAVDNNFSFRGKPTSEVTIQIRYWDEGMGDLSIQYCGSDIMQGNSKYFLTASDTISRTGTKSWKTGTISITDFGGYNTMEGTSDFRIVVDGDPVIISRVIVSTKQPVEEPRPAPPAPPAAVCGDANGDGKVAVADAILALQIAVGTRKATDAQLSALDFNGDGKVAIGEVILVLRKAVNPAFTLTGANCK